jgi:hypothetical protein
MRLSRQLAAGLLALAACAGPARAGAPPDRPGKAEGKPAALPSPLRLIPAEANFFLQVRDPRRLAETVADLDTLKELYAFPAVKEYFAGTQSRRGRQLLAYAEKELGAKWPELLDRLAGGGAVLGLRYGANPAPTLLAVQGRDEELLKKFVKLLGTVIEGELARQESGQRVVRRTYQKVELVSVGKEFHLAQAGAALLVSNNEEALRRGLHLHLGREKKSLAAAENVASAAKLLPKGPLVNAMIDMEAFQNSEPGKAFYKTPRDFFPFTILFGSYLDVLGRTPFVCAGVYAEKDGFRAAVRAPRGREGMGSDLALHLPPKADDPGSRPLLEPKGVLYSQSFYLDTASIWKDRDKLFNQEIAKGLQTVDKNPVLALAGAKISRLLTQAGPYHRIVVVNQPTAGYEKKPRQPIPAFALVTELREPEQFGKSMESVLRSGALLARGQFKLKLAEEKYQGVAITGYRFDEKAPLKQDVNDIRFNFSPCFARVGNQFVWCSTLELCRELVGLLQREEKDGKSAPAASRRRIYARGGAEFLSAVEDQLVTQTILDQAVPVEEAREQVKAFLALVRKLGTLSAEADFRDNEMRFDFRTGK